VLSSRLKSSKHLGAQPAVQADGVELSLLVDETPDRRREGAEVWPVPLCGSG